MTPRWTSPLTGSQVYEANSRDVAPLFEGRASLAILDGAYGLSKAAWDKVPRGGTLADLYQGHLDDVGRVCAASASLYLWNTSAGWAELHPHILARGWTFRSLIVWHKTGPNPALISALKASKWPDVTEVCGHYSRGDKPYHVNDGTSNVWRFGLVSDLGAERLLSGQVSRRTFGAPGRQDMQFCEDTLHPCQKPLIFAERMIRASSRPGDLVWAPFGGTLREMVAAERMARLDPAEARKVITCELNLDGRDYIGAALEQIGAEVREKGGQVGLFGGAR